MYKKARIRTLFPKPQILTVVLFFLLICTILLQLDEIIRLICLKTTRENDQSVCSGNDFSRLGRRLGSKKWILVPSFSIKHVGRLPNFLILVFPPLVSIFHFLFATIIFSSYFSKKCALRFFENQLQSYENHSQQRPLYYTYSVFEDFCLKIASHIYPWLPTPNF
jgi:hypothetical protein